ncbi:helix-turn-helix transcriptional regulator [Actinoplanes sp. NPDC051633]|uniref:helix-turn-helix transcriptional regulator n=1 Tax=Actinoplanes sp. NPDC051633 TaxID=3155670 RepID=UPI0034406209
MSSPSPLAKKLRDLRHAAGLTQGALGPALGVSTSTISSWETGTAPAEHRLDDYARLFATIRDGRAPLDRPGRHGAWRTAAV